jgi:hypothetical protein
LSFVKDALPLRPPSATKQIKPNSFYSTRRNLLVDKSFNLNPTNHHQASASSSVEHNRSLPMTYSSTNLFNSYNILASAAMRGTDHLHEDDSDDEDDSHDDDDEQPSFLQSQSQMVSSSSLSSQPPLVSINAKKSQIVTSRSFSPAVFYHKKHQYDQESSKKSLYHSHYQERTATATATTTAATTTTTTTTTNLVTKHDSTDSLDSYAPNSINTLLSTANYPSVSLGKYV